MNFAKLGSGIISIVFWVLLFNMVNYSVAFECKFYLGKISIHVYGFTIGSLLKQLKLRVLMVHCIIIITNNNN